MFTDSHCHLQLIDYAKLGTTEADVVAGAQASGIIDMLCVATQLSQFQELLRITAAYSGVRMSIGVHPNEVEEEFTQAELLTMAGHQSVVAIGETGLDYYRTTDAAEITAQQAKFAAHMEVAAAVNKPLIVHTRSAKEDTIKMLQEARLKHPNLTGVIHCFTEDLDMAMRCIELGFYISFSGIVSFHNAVELQQVAMAVPLSSMLIETDCPYLAPQPMRGKINQPAYVAHVATAIAALKGTTLDEVAAATTANYQRLFKLEKS
jgi:TatD DNase family protein